MKCIMSSIHTCSQINQPCFQSKVTDFFPVVCLNARNTLEDLEEVQRSPKLIIRMVPTFVCSNEIKGEVRSDSR